MFISKTKINKSNDTVSIKLHDFAVEEMYDYIVPDFLCLKSVIFIESRVSCNTLKSFSDKSELMENQ